jgi:hypothetical protein
MKNKYFEEFKKKGYFEKFDKKYFEEFEKELEEVINPLQNNWNNLSENDLESLLKKFGKITRDETSQLRKEVLSEGAIAKTLLGIANKYYNNSKMLTEIISSIDNMHNRYGLEITNDIFEFLAEQTKNKKVNFYVSIFITSLPQFEKYKYKWDYILSIPDIAPKKKSINTFYSVINNNVEDMPNKDKTNVIKIFEAFLNDNPNLHKTTIEKYSSMINKLKD